MKKVTKCLLKITALGAVLGGTFAYLKNKGYITVSHIHNDEDYDDFSCPDHECGSRTYIHVDTDAMKHKAKEVAQDVKEKAQNMAEDLMDEIKDKAEDAYDEAKQMASNAKENIASSIEKAWYQASEQGEKVEEFFNDEK